MPHLDSWSAGAASLDRRTRQSSPAFNTKFRLGLWERRGDGTSRAVLPDVNVSLIKTYSTVHSKEGPLSKRNFSRTDFFSTVGRVR